MFSIARTTTRVCCFLPDRTVAQSNFQSKVVLHGERNHGICEVKQSLGRPWWEQRAGRSRGPIVNVTEGRTMRELDAVNLNVNLKAKNIEVLIAATMTMLFGVGNKVLYKLALVPLKNYPFFLAQLATFGYVVVYFSILYIRYKAGIVTKEMLSLPKSRFLAVGALEALGMASGMAAGSMLSGASIPILSQTFLVWQLILSFIFLGRRYTLNQIFGCLLISFGVIITVSSGGGSGTSLQQTGFVWPLLMIVSFLFQAGDTILKEIIFLDAAKQLKGGSVDLFVINSFGSGFQALFILLLLPFLSRLWGVPFAQLPGYLRDGAACFVNAGSLAKGCEGAPLLPLLFILVNMGFNISLLHLLKISSAVVSSLAATFSVPLSIFMFTLPLPYIGVDSSLPPGFLMGAAVLVIGLFVYNLSNHTKEATK
ncbi:hypothetical protein SUGI_0192670 [Cryptomeria japonica]|nr:hypothetical protein SUGI_0192670 [Cryptomeria japonica]